MNFDFLGDYTAVKFTGISRLFDVASTCFSVEMFGKTFEVKWYGVLIAFGYSLAVLFGGRMAFKWKIDLNKMLDVLIYGTVAAIVGARLYYVFSQWDYFGKNPLQIFNLRGGGLAIYGGLIGGILAAYLTCRLEKLNFYNLLDMAGISFLIGQGIGRWGNFTNQEAFGTNTNLPWGMWSEKVSQSIQRSLPELVVERGIIIDPMKPVHPTFLYESLWCLAGAGILYLILRKYRKFSGQIFICYGIWYGLERFFVEGLRTDSLYIPGTGIRQSQLLSLVLALACIVLLIVKLRKYLRNPQPIEGVDFFPEKVIKIKGKSKKEAAAAEALTEPPKDTPPPKEESPEEENKTD